MIEKNEAIKGRKVEEYSFEYGNEDLESQIKILDPKKDSKKISELELEFKHYGYKIQEPTFDQLVASLSQVKPDGRMDVIGAGKVIWELCCVAHDSDIVSDSRILIAVCIELANTYSLPIDIEIKKK